jgi:hypothetical protein
MPHFTHLYAGQSMSRFEPTRPKQQHRTLRIVLCTTLLITLQCSIRPAAAQTSLPCGSRQSMPSSHGTACLLTTSTTGVGNGSVTTIHIQNPVVDRPSYDYLTVSLQPGDHITLTAGGCVQTGGFGATWKRYVNPGGDNSGSDDPGLYHGTVTIQGGVAEIPQTGVPDISQPVRRWSIRAAELVAIDVLRPEADRPPPLPPRLTLGYADDNYGDNGYDKHDNGNGDQCAPSRDGGNAYVDVKIEHRDPLSVPAALGYKAFDLVPTGFDYNWLPLNPAWGWQLPNTRSIGGTTGGNFRTECGVDAIAPAPASCTNDYTVMNPAPDPSLFSSAPWTAIADFFGLCRLNGDLTNPGTWNGPNAGHLNWGEVAYSNSTVTWNGWDNPLHGDDDYNMNLFTPYPPGPPDRSARSGVAPASHRTVKLEFDSDETIDHFDRVPWWHQLHNAVSGLFGDPKSMVDGHDAVVVGLMGLDAVHGADSEVHPVHILAIRESNPGVPNDDAWAFFARNWGNEGQCSTRQENLESQTITIQLPKPASFSAVSPKATLLGEHHIVGHGVNENPVDFFSDSQYLTFHLPPADQHGFVAGEIHLRWSDAGTPIPLVTTTRSPKSSDAVPPTAVATATIAQPEQDSPEAQLNELYSGLNDAQRSVYSSALRPWSNSDTPVSVTPVGINDLTSPPPRPSFRLTTGDAFDPVHVRNVTSRILTLCQAYDGSGPAFVVDMCGGLFSGSLGIPENSPQIVPVPGAPPGPDNPALPVAMTWPVSPATPPRFTSAMSTSFTVGAPNSFHVFTAGMPGPTLDVIGDLPTGLVFDAATGTLAGTPARGTAGSYGLTFIASNGIPPDAKQPFTLTVNQAVTTNVVSLTPTRPAYAAPVTFTASVAPVPPLTSRPGGTVSFYLDGQPTPVATVAVIDRVAKFTTKGLGAGLHTVTAIYNGDATFASSASAAAPLTVTTRTIITGSHPADLIVTPGMTVLLNNATVGGRVILQSGAELDIEDSTIAGPFTASWSGALRICGSNIHGSLSVNGASNIVLLGDQSDDGCAPNTIGGSLILQNNHFGLEVIGNKVTGAIAISGNSGTGAFPEDSAPEISGNGHDREAA